ncbi:MAG: peptidoglycan DD-metalloendopeptidase family protein [Phenylobacterium sp.]|jgi:murein DD-endopeptidase MepM/ murein hydrolase activator NlpD|uniref:peptidoglycan DD-metalloendopeptidase family protein n=1 Tax=Phenylobacterium sp. TaxID=1871053 RepID=UPI00391A84EC
MQEFDPRRPALRLTPRLVLGVAGAATVIAGWQAIASATAPVPPAPMDPAEIAALQHAAFTQAEAQPGFTRPENVPVRVLPGETLENAVRRAGVAPEEAREAVETLGAAMDTVHIKAGMAFDAAVARPRGERGHARLVGLSLRTGPATAITLSRTFDGAMRLREMEEKIREEKMVARGEIAGSLYESASRLGANPTQVVNMVKLFSHKVDFDRDLKPGDEFVMIFDRKVTESGRTIDNGPLEYAAIRGVQFYRFQRSDGQVEYFDEQGKNVRGFLLRTPVDNARMTSRFGMRRHPILGYNRMHQGIDFGAGAGTPIFAAGDGVVVEARRWGGYGNWVRIRHAGGFETGYAHTSRFAKGIRAGQAVKQGQVIAYVGSTGASTGPHLHYEIWHHGKRINPVGAKVPQGTVLAGAELAAFKAQKARIDRMIAGEADGIQLARADTDEAKAAGLRRTSAE